MHSNIFCQRGAWPSRMVFLAVTLLCACASQDTDSPTPEVTPVSSAPCSWDDDDGLEQANAIELASADSMGSESTAQGYVCPVGDQDWYRFSVLEGSPLVTVTVSLDAPVSPIELTYAIWTGDGVSIAATPLADEAAGAGSPLKITYRLAAGDYVLALRDVASDGEDVRHPYFMQLTSDAEPDLLEPNDAAAEATFAGISQQGFIASRGDQDWYRVEASGPTVLDLHLAMEASEVNVAYRIADELEHTLLSGVAQGGTEDSATTEASLGLESAGLYYIVISDDDHREFSDIVPYTLELSLEGDPDANEPNDHPEQATELPKLKCATQWSSWDSARGTLASTGDIDWYALELDGCAAGVLEAEVEFDAEELPSNLQAALRFVREVEGESCVLDEDCQTLSTACEEDFDCLWLGNSCLPEGVCAGADVCLPSGNCGATLLAERADDAFPGRVATALPLRSWSSLYLAVSDYLADAQGLELGYLLSARSHVDPDSFEPSEAYTAGPPAREDSSIEHIPFATEVPVHDCSSGDCCSESTWAEGQLAYAYDQDWFKYLHPCPGEDCMVRFVYDFDSGPADFYTRVYRGSSAWYDNLTDTVDQSMQLAQEGYFGGLEADDTCFYAYQGHSGEPYYYYLSIRDTTYVAKGLEDAGTWDWDVDQSYRFCLEKIADGCHSPCKLYSDGCGSP